MAEPLRFNLRNLQAEVVAMAALASRFINPSRVYLLQEALKTLRVATGQRDRRFDWQIPEERPLRTNTSAGEYESRNMGDHAKGLHVIGELSFKWEMRTADEPKVSDALLSGNASTLIRLLDAADESEIAMWRMEIGAEDSPGACFHSQIRGETNENPFPSSLPVPRLPSLSPTPMSCLEFLLSELFQHRWREEVLRSRDEARIWRKIQKERLEAFLRWHQEIVSTTSAGSPMVRLKAFPAGLRL